MYVAQWGYEKWWYSNIVSSIFTEVPEWCLYCMNQFISQVQSVLWTLKTLIFPRNCSSPTVSVHILISKLPCSPDSTMTAQIFIESWHSSYLHQGSQSTGGFGLVRPLSLSLSCAQLCRRQRRSCVSLCWVSRLHQAVFQTGVINTVLHVHQTVAVSGAVLHKVN